MTNKERTPLENIAAAIDPTIWALPAEFTAHRRQVSLEKARAVLELIKEESGDFEDEGSEVADVQREIVGPYDAYTYLSNPSEVFDAIIDAMAAYTNKEPAVAAELKGEAA